MHLQGSGCMYDMVGRMQMWCRAWNSHAPAHLAVAVVKLQKFAVHIEAVCNA